MAGEGLGGDFKRVVVACDAPRFSGHGSGILVLGQERDAIRVLADYSLDVCHNVSSLAGALRRAYAAAGDGAGVYVDADDVLLYSLPAEGAPLLRSLVLRRRRDHVEHMLYLWASEQVVLADGLGRLASDLGMVKTSGPLHVPDRVEALLIGIEALRVLGRSHDSLRR